MKDLRPVKDTILLLLRASGRYVHAHISNEKDRAAYADGIKGVIRGLEMCEKEVLIFRTNCGAKFSFPHIVPQYPSNLQTQFPKERKSSE